MIINFATGLYNTVLPKEPSDGGNVTFTISNQPPPRTNLLFPKIPQALVEKKRQSSSRNSLDVRPTLGELAFTVNTSDRSQAGNGQNVYEIGQVLEFNNESILATEPMLVAPSTTIQHDISLIDYESLGLNQAQVAELSAKALNSFNDLMNQLNQTVQDRKNADTVIVDLQKIINDSDRTINALNVLQSEETGTDGFVDDLLTQVEARKASAIADRDAKIAQANQLADDAAVLQNELRQVGTVVK